MELPAMNERLLDEEEEEAHWEPPVRNLDKFFKSMYNYHYSKGLLTILITQLCTAISLGFTTFFSTFLIGFVDWNSLSDCRDELSCGPFSDYIVSDPTQKFSLVRNLFTLVYCILLSTFWTWRTYHALSTVRRALQMEVFYRDKLGISSAELQSFSWDDVVQRLIRLHDHGVHRVAIKDKLTEEDVVLRIMRKENYMIGLVNKQILDLRVPWWLAPYVSERLFLTKSLEWSLNFCIMEYMFNDQFNISSLFLKDVVGLQGRFMMVGFIHLALLPFMVIFMILTFFLQNASAFHTSKAYLGPRQWSPLALWTFREFNELPHVFEARMNKSYAPANEYLSLFHHTNAAVVARTAAYISGGFIAFLLLISCFSEGAFLYVNIWERNLLFWLGVLTAAYAGARSAVPDETRQKGDPEQLMTAISAHTHHFPVKWENNCHTAAVHDEMAELFPYKVKLFGLEILSVVLTPLVLCFSLPSCAPTIIEFVREHSRYVEGVGAVCDYSLFDFQKYGDEAFGAAASGFLESSLRPNDGKLEQSFINFQAEHPHWTGGGEGGAALRQRLEAFRAMKEQERVAHLSESLQRSLYPVSTGPAGQIPKFTLETDTPPRQTGINSHPSDGDASTPSGAIPNGTHTNSTIKPSQAHRPPAPIVAGAAGVWTPQGYMKSSHYTPTSAATVTTINMQSPEPNHTSHRNTGIINNNQHLLSSSLRAGEMRPIQNNPSAFATPSLHSRSQDPTQSMLGGDAASVPSLLRSILNQENIDYQNDFYWMQRFRLERERDPRALEHSLAQSLLYSQTSLNPNSILQRNSYSARRVYDSRRTGAVSANSDLDLDLSLTAIGDHPVPSFNEASQLSQLRPSQSVSTAPRVAVPTNTLPVESALEDSDVDKSSQKVSL